MTKKGTKLNITWKGTCNRCGSEFEATNKEIIEGGPTEYCIREHYQFAHRTCPECNNIFTLHPKKK